MSWVSGGIQYELFSFKLKSLLHVTQPLTVSSKHDRHVESHFMQYDVW